MANTKKNVGQKRYQKAQSRKQKLKLIKSQLQAKSSLPFSRQGRLLECVISDTFDEGIGHIAFSFELPDGKIGLVHFLVDSYCLGVKDIFRKKMPYSEYEMILDDMMDNLGLLPIEPSRAKKQVMDSVTYAASLGFKPHKDYEKSLAELIAIDEKQCQETFVFGCEGKPLYIAGPNDDFAKSQKIIDTLDKNCGEGNYEYTAMLDNDFSLLEDSEDELLSESSIKLPEKETDLFFELMWALQYFINRKLKILSHVKNVTEYGKKLSMAEKMRVREALFNQPALITEFIEKNPENFSKEKLEIIAGWQNFVTGQFVIERFLEESAIFIQDDKVYEVVGLYDGIDEIVSLEHLPVPVKATLLPFKGKIIYDGILQTANVVLGNNICAELNDLYITAKKNNNIIKELTSSAMSYTKQKTPLLELCDS